MMTRAQIRRLIIDFARVLLVSVCVILLGVFLSMDKEEIRLQKTYQKNFSDILPADKYEELEHDLIDTTDGVNHVYIAYDSNGELIGYIADVSVKNSVNDELHSLFAVSSDGSSIIGYKRVGDELNPLKLSDEDLMTLSSQVINKPMPIPIIIPKIIETVIEASASSTICLP